MGNTQVVFFSWMTQYLQMAAVHIRSERAICLQHMSLYYTKYYQMNGFIHGFSYSDRSSYYNFKITDFCMFLVGVAVLIMLCD